MGVAVHIPKPPALSYMACQENSTILSPLTCLFQPLPIWRTTTSSPTIWRGGGMWKDTINNVMAKIRIKASSCFQTQSLKHFLSSLTCIYSVENLFCLLIIFFHLPDTHCIYMIHVWTCKVTVSFNTWSNLQIISRNTLSDNEHSSHINIAHLNIDIIKLFGQFVICQVNQHFLCILPDILHVSLSLKLLWTRNKLGSFLFVS